MAAEWAAAARLVRRAGFGATGAQVDAAVKEGARSYLTRILTADTSADAGARRTPPPTLAHLAPAGKNTDPDERKQHNHALRRQDETLTSWWIQRMVAVSEPFTERLTFAWHAHFATSLKKVRFAQLMLAQNERQRALGTGRFDTLAYAMLTDAATLRWLDGEKNTVTGPNENLSREFMEIFTLGVTDGYSENDVRAGARALTGLKIDRQDGSVSLRPALHDNGTKTFLGVTGELGPKDYCDAVLAQPGCPRFVLLSLWNTFVSNNQPADSTMDRLLAAYGSTHDLKALFGVMFTDESFVAAQGSYLVSPVEWLVGVLRTLPVDLSRPQQLRAVVATLDALGQLPFYPPSVGGWPSGMVWMSTAAADLRFRAATTLLATVDLPTLSGSTTAKLEALAHLLAVDSWSPASLAVLKGVTNRPRELLAVAVNTPEYLVH